MSDSSLGLLAAMAVGNVMGMVIAFFSIWLVFL
jgi:hypothetical protein